MQFFPVLAEMADPEVIQIPDAGGNPLTMKRYKGRLWPDFENESIEGVETFKSRDEDVLVVAYPKSGTHWSWEILRFLLAGTTDLPEASKSVGFIEASLPKDLEAQPSPRPLNTHAHFELMPVDVLKRKTCKLIYVTRDPRDVAVSYYNHHYKIKELYNYDGQWKDYFSMYLSGKVDYESWFAYTRSWERGIKENPDLKVHVTSYEALHKNTVEEIKTLAVFLGASTEDELIKAILNKTSFENMHKTKFQVRKTESGEEITEPDIIYRKGKVGDWKNWFTVAQSEQFDAVFEREMQGTEAYKLYSNKRQDSKTPGKIPS